MANNTEVIFENIEQRILNEIESAHYAIFVSVAWFTNKRLFNALLDKAKSNCYVSIIIQLDEINSQSGIDYTQINIGRSECFMISKDAELLHEKFCVIDFKKVITGSYNWTYKASYNSENILILNDPSVAAQYISRFEQQKTKFNSSSISTISSVSTISNNNSTDVNATNTIIPSQQKRCSSCGTKLGIDDIFCPYCGTQQNMGNMGASIICNKCSHKQVPPILSRSTKYCTNCGYKIRQQELSPNNCPICKNGINDRYFHRKFCTYCGLSDHIYILSDKESNYQPILKGVRPEFEMFEQIQKCYKCGVINIWGAHYCRRCGENIFSHAKDKYGYEWVDLGLSVLWSSRTYKGYYRWMDTERQNYQGWFSYWTGNRANKDTASELFGYKWRMPTKQEVEELIELCKWEKVTEEPYNYCYLKIIGPNGNHILLPLDSIDYGYELKFWTSTTDEKQNPLAFQYSCLPSLDPVVKRALRMRMHSKTQALNIVPVADKKWQGKL